MYIQRIRDFLERKLPVTVSLGPDPRLLPAVMTSSSRIRSGRKLQQGKTYRDVQVTVLPEKVH